MRVRIIFRGLTLFTFQNGSTKNAEGGTDMGELTAWLISDPKMVGHPLHEHRPKLATLGRDSHAGNGRAAPRRPIPDELRLTLMGHDAPQRGVTVAESFLDYVPRLSALHWRPPTLPEIVNRLATQLGSPDGFVTKKIVIPTGTIRAREFISWDFHGNTPTRVAFMDTQYQGFAANEVIVDIGDDSDPQGADKDKHLVMEDGKTQERLWSYTKGSEVDEDIEPNMVELLFTNNTARRGISVFWGLHMMSLFDAAGYARRDAYANTDQFDAFERVAVQYDPNEWPTDRRAMGIGQPFPFLMVHTDDDKLNALRDAGRPYIIPGAPPRPAGQRKRDAGGGGAAHVHDPVNITICPLGRE